MHRKVVIPNDFITDLAQIEQRPAQFEACYNATALPRAWNFTRTDLDALLCRIAEHEATSPRPLARLTPRRCGGAAAPAPTADALRVNHLDKIRIWLVH